MDALEIKFQRLLRSGEFESAREALEMWQESSHPPIAVAAHRHSALLCQEGRYQDAAVILSRVIDALLDINQLCRVRRARTYMALGKFQSALFDWQTIAADPSTIVQEAIGGSSRFMIAYIFARSGSPEFAKAFSQIVPNAEDYVVDRVLKSADLQELYIKARSVST